MLTVFGAVAELERDYIRQRQKERNWNCGKR
jgi:DNA invertase Pin-like site-specific DNA recombinase